MDYATLSLADVRTGLDNIGRETHATFGGFSARQLNWRPDVARWSVAQCFQHLLTANHLMFQAADDALNEAPRTVWQRLPVVPGRPWSDAGSLTGTEHGAKVHRTIQSAARDQRHCCGHHSSFRRAAP